MMDMMTVYLAVAIVCAILLIVMAAMGGFGGAHDMDMGGHDMDFGGHDMDAGGHGMGGHDTDMGHYNAGHGDYSGSHLSPLSIPVLLAFGTAFGAVGAILTDLEVESIAALVGSIVSGVVMAGGMYAIVYFMIFKSQASTLTSLNDMVGLTGLLTVGIKNKEQGQVVVNTEKRGRVPVSASATEDIESNTTVKVIGVAGDAVMVERVKEV